MSLTFTQLMNNINSLEKDIQQKAEACRVLAKHHCFEEAGVMAVRIVGRAKDLQRLFEGFDFEKAEF